MEKLKVEVDRLDNEKFDTEDAEKLMESILTEYNEKLGKLKKNVHDLGEKKMDRADAEKLKETAGSHNIDIEKLKMDLNALSENKADLAEMESLRKSFQQKAETISQDYEAYHENEMNELKKGLKSIIDNLGKKEKYTSNPYEHNKLFEKQTYHEGH